MGFGITELSFAITEETLRDLLEGRFAQALILRPLTPADARTTETSQLLPFSDAPEDVEQYLKHNGLWFVRPHNVEGTVLLWDCKLPSTRYWRFLRKGEVDITISGLFPGYRSIDPDELTLKLTAESLISLGARRLPKYTLILSLFEALDGSSD